MILYLIRTNLSNNTLKIEIAEVLKDKTVLIYLSSVLIPALLVATKTEWYIMPIFPALSIMTSWFLYNIISKEHKAILNIIKRVISPTIFVIAENTTLLISTRTYLRGFQFRSGNIEKLISEFHLQNLLVSEKYSKTQH